MVVSGLLLGAMIGALAAGRLADRLGRKKLIISGSIVFVIGTIGAALSVSAPMLIAFRLVIGLGVGIVSVWYRCTSVSSLRSRFAVRFLR